MRVHATEEASVTDSLLGLPNKPEYNEYMERAYAAVNLNSFSSITKFEDIGSLISVIIPNAFVLAGVITFVLLVLAGFGMIAAAGSGDTKKLESGKKTITGAVIGLIVIVGSLWIITIIQTLTGLNGTGGGLNMFPTLN